MKQKKAETYSLRKTRMRDAKNDKIDFMIICRDLALDLRTEVTLNDAP